MSETVKHCPDCGAANELTATFCRYCYASMKRETAPAVETLEGIDKAEWHNFVDKNASYYVDTFSANEGKKVFFRFNWAAFLFNIYWMCYRKMYVYAAIFFAVTTLFTFGLAAAVVTAHQPAIDELNQFIEPYEQYLMDSGTDQLLAAGTDGTVEVSEVLEAMQRYQTEYNGIVIQIGFWLFIPTLLMGVVFGLLANCLYRGYVRRNIERNEGGVSVGGMIVSIVACQLISNLAVTPLVTGMVELLMK